MVRHGAGAPKNDCVLKIGGPWVHRVEDIRERAKEFIEVLKLSGAGAEELAVALIAIIADLEREVHNKRRRA